MTPPAWLTSEARKFFVKHAKRLTAEGKLTDANEASYTLLCVTWGQLRAIDFEGDDKANIKFVSLMKQFERYSKGFEMFPSKGDGNKAQSLADVLRDTLG